MTTDLTSSAMLVTLQCSAWGATKAFKAGAAHLERDYSAETGTMSAAKRLVDKTVFSELTALRTLAMAEHTQRTLPWYQDGRRILLTPGYGEYCKVLDKIVAQFEAAKHLCGQRYAAMRDHAHCRLGNAFSDRDYPDVATALQKFSISYIPEPMYASGDFRLTLSQAHLDNLRAATEERMRAQFNEARRDVMLRITTAVKAMHDKLSGYQPDNASQDGRKGRFWDSLVTGMVDMLDILPSLNLGEDASLSETIALMRGLVQHDAQTLRDDRASREAVISTAKSVLSRVSEFI